ncbi:unnamed protein product [Ranitomeya imitator]|uniref:UPAR/Ly6 domain-containing protein n=1 Tax=Ranitomeya imitator TaxID=111125 RepID=A0ABN9MH58_9NEOB|nr:unnamed protein product [Ranitomeya imitator]
MEAKHLLYLTILILSSSQTVTSLQCYACTDLSCNNNPYKMPCPAGHRCLSVSFTYGTTINVKIREMDAMLQWSSGPHRRCSDTDNDPNRCSVAVWSLESCHTDRSPATNDAGNQGKHRVTKRRAALSNPMFTLVTMLKVKKNKHYILTYSRLSSSAALCFSALLLYCLGAGKQSGDVTALLSGSQPVQEECRAQRWRTDSCSEDIAGSVSHTPIQRCLQGVQRRNKVLDFIQRPTISQQGPDRWSLSHITISLTISLLRHK